MTILFRVAMAFLIERVLRPCFGHNNLEQKGGGDMSYVNPAIREAFESLSIDLKNEILSRELRLETMSDLIQVLEQISRGE